MLCTTSPICLLALLLLQVTGLVITRDPEQNALISISTPVTTTQQQTGPSPSSSVTPIPTLVTPSSIDEQLSVVTPAPENSGVALQKRQPCCFNDQGFRVDCAQWTGYYYTWGPPGNPYEGGPQCDGNWNGGSGSGNGGDGNQNGGGGQVVVYDGSAADWHRSESYMVLGIALLLLALGL